MAGPRLLRKGDGRATGQRLRRRGPQLTQAIQESPDTGNYYYWRGDTRVRLQDFQRDHGLQQVDRIDAPGSAESRRPRHRRLWLDNPQAAVDDLTTAITTVCTPDKISAWAFRARGLAFASLGQSDSAVADYNQYLSLTPNAPDKDQVTGWIADLSS